MKIQLDHHFLHTAHDITALLEDVQTMKDFKKNLVKQSKLHPARYDSNLYTGDGLELFTEALIKLSPVDNRIGIQNYIPIIEGGDNGVDGSGVGFDGKPATVQVKFRSNNTTRLTGSGDDLNSFYGESLGPRFLVDPLTTSNLLLVTTGAGLHHYTEGEKFSNSMRCLGWNELKDLVDNNLSFWNHFRELCNG